MSQRIYHSTWSVLAGALAGIVLFAMGSISQASSLAWTKTGPVGESLGGGACGGSDINGDGYNDVVAGSPGYANGGPNNAKGKVTIWSGRDGGATTLATLIGEKAGDGFGESGGGAGDVNGDGVGDFVIGASGWTQSYGKIYVYAGHATGNPTLLYSKDGKSLGLAKHVQFAELDTTPRSPGDFDGDGRDDFAAGAFGHSAGNGRVFVWSGATGAQLFSATGTIAGQLGFRMDFADVNNDGRSDLVVSENIANANKGRVRVFLGPSGIEAPYSPINGENAGDRFGGSVATAGDFNADGYEDIVVGAGAFGGSSTGKVYVYSGFNGLLLASVVGSAAGTLGQRVDTAGDFNQDGFSDIMTVSPNTKRFSVYTGPDLGGGVPYYTYTSSLIGFGRNLCHLGDTNGDLFPEALVGDPDSGSTNLFVFTGNP